MSRFAAASMLLLVLGQSPAAEDSGGREPPPPAAAARGSFRPGDWVSRAVLLSRGGEASFAALLEAMHSPDFRARAAGRMGFRLMKGGPAESRARGFLEAELSGGPDADLSAGIRGILAHFGGPLPDLDARAARAVFDEFSGTPAASWNPAADRFPVPAAGSGEFMRRLAPVQRQAAVAAAADLSSESRIRRINAAFALAGLCEAGALPEIERAARSAGDPECRIMAMHAAARMAEARKAAGGDVAQAAAFFASLASDGSAEVRRFAVACLERTGVLDGPVPAALAAALGDSDAAVSYEAEFVLRKLCGASFRFNPLWEEKRRKAAAEALLARLARGKAGEGRD